VTFSETFLRLVQRVPAYRRGKAIIAALGCAALEAHAQGRIRPFMDGMESGDWKHLSDACERAALAELRRLGRRVREFPR
jgi:hypothetical protein